jgi:hypothetical protein
MSTLGPRSASVWGPPLEDVLDVPVKADGTFEFGHLPPGKYLVSLFPPTPGIASYPVTMAGEKDVSDVELVPMPTKTVSGRIAVKNGALPYGILGFYTEKTYVGGKINVDGTFKVDLHAATHEIDFAGLPVGYSLATVRAGDQDVTQRGITVGNSDIPDVIITVNAPRKLAIVKGKVTGLAQDRYASTPVVLTGPTFNKIQADIEQNGSFEFPAVVPGLYSLTLTGVPEFQPATVVVDGFRTFEVSVVVPSR